MKPKVLLRWKKSSAKTRYGADFLRKFTGTELTCGILLLALLLRLPTTSYELEAITGDFPADRPVIAVLHLILSDSTFKSWSKKIQALPQNKNDVLSLNGFFTGVQLPDQRMLWSGSWYFAPGALCRRNSENLPEKLSGIITFYQVNSPAKP